ncbi:hypothetical protein CEXT_675371 [Caerostris extrusa]|uniref:Uncharacterized protein n=1 Tax=Caerostris extrusa TaxID=172846 RepID=A0AAV4SS80_CAEEX|nr:hypothetical protein CEXT_675371 [Caerostris extrusa]
MFVGKSDRWLHVSLMCKSFILWATIGDKIADQEHFQGVALLRSLPCYIGETNEKYYKTASKLLNHKFPLSIQSLANAVKFVVESLLFHEGCLMDASSVFIN